MASFYCLKSLIADELGCVVLQHTKVRAVLDAGALSANWPRLRHVVLDARLVLDLILLRPDY